MKYTTTNIRLPKNHLLALKIKAAKEGKSLAQLIREAIEKTYGVGEKFPAINPKDDPIYGLIGFCKSGVADGSVNHDRDIYGIEP